MDKRAQPRLLHPRSHARHPSGEEDEDWSDSSSEIPIHNRHNQMLRRELGAESAHQAHANDPGNAGYMREAGGEAIPYQQGQYDDNPFTPSYRPEIPRARAQDAFGPFPMSQPASPAYQMGYNGYIRGPYPTNDHFANGYNANYPQPAPYQYSTNTQSPNHHPAPQNYYHGDDFYSGPHPTPQYPAVPATQGSPPVFASTYPDYEPERTRRPPDNYRAERRHRKKRPTPVRREKEEADHRETRKSFQKLQRQLDEVKSVLSQQRDIEIRSDPGRLRLDSLLRSSSALGRHIPDDLRSWDERRGREPERLLEDIHRLIEESRRQGDRGSYVSSRRESLEAPSRDRLELERGELMELRGDQELHRKVEAILIDILGDLKLEDPEESRSPRRPASGEYIDAPIAPVTPASGHPPPRPSRVQNLPSEFSRSTNQERQQGPAYRNQTTQTPRQARLQRNSTRGEEDLEPFAQNSREPSDPRFLSSETRRGQATRASESRDNVGRRRGQPEVYWKIDNFDTMQGRPVVTVRRRSNVKFHAKVQDDDDTESDEPEEPCPTRTPALYELRQGHPNLKDSFPLVAAPDPPPPFRRRRAGNDG
ncbi:hypothetical protein AK830_g10673 [Neonectria ditissima]|uniref:Uncharacterized protein n=1 Tax=Neonectria ditissima TaxID=78410 RepID=A0A0P7B9Y5_9HYPO|nr:hypothetical protein AK830_g10673 [Neonectria ditissima]